MLARGAEQGIEQQAGQASGTEDQQREVERGLEAGAEQQAEEYAVVAIEAGVDVCGGVAPAYGGEPGGCTSEQRAAQQLGRTDGDGEENQRAASGMALEENLAESVELGGSPATDFGS
ncbi:hypothetical protein FQZ97_906670 [compost metagenome]